MACLKFLEAHTNRHNWTDTHTHHNTFRDQGFTQFWRGTGRFFLCTFTLLDYLCNAHYCNAKTCGGRRKGWGASPPISR